MGGGGGEGRGEGEGGGRREEGGREGEPSYFLALQLMDQVKPPSSPWGVGVPPPPVDISLRLALEAGPALAEGSLHQQSSGKQQGAHNQDLGLESGLVFHSSLPGPLHHNPGHPACL